MNNPNNDFFYRKIKNNIEDAISAIYDSVVSPKYRIVQEGKMFVGFPRNVNFECVLRIDEESGDEIKISCELPFIIKGKKPKLDNSENVFEYKHYHD